MNNEKHLINTETLLPANALLNIRGTAKVILILKNGHKSNLELKYRFYDTDLGISVPEIFFNRYIGNSEIKQKLKRRYDEYFGIYVSFSKWPTHDTVCCYQDIWFNNFPKLLQIHNIARGYYIINHLSVMDCIEQCILEVFNLFRATGNIEIDKMEVTHGKITREKIFKVSID